MTNFIFKSQWTLKKLANTLEVILSEQRHQRMDLADIQRKLQLLINDTKLQKQVDDFYETHPEDITDDTDVH